MATSLLGATAKLMVSYGGKIRPGSNQQLTYAGGVHRLITVSRSVSLLELRYRLAALVGGDLRSVSVRYALPGAGLEALRDVATEEDVRYILELTRNRDALIRELGVSSAKIRRVRVFVDRVESEFSSTDAFRPLYATQPPAPSALMKRTVSAPSFSRDDAPHSEALRRSVSSPPLPASSAAAPTQDSTAAPVEQSISSPVSLIDMDYTSVYQTQPSPSALVKSTSSFPTDEYDTPPSEALLRSASCASLSAESTAAMTTISASSVPPVIPDTYGLVAAAVPAFFPAEQRRLIPVFLVPVAQVSFVVYQPVFLVPVFHCASPVQCRA